MPLKLKSVSMTRAPQNIAGMYRPIIVMTGNMALRSVCTKTTRNSDRPFARAVRTYCSLRLSTIEERT